MAKFLAEYQEEIELSPAAIEYLAEFLADWGLLSDLAFSDLVLWLPTWHKKGYFAVGQIRPATVASQVPEDLVSEFLAVGRNRLLDKVLASKKINLQEEKKQLRNKAVIPIVFEQKVIGLLERTWLADGRGGRMEEVYLAAAEAIFKMLEQGNQPFLTSAEKITGTPRVGDGIIQLNEVGQVVFVSPNAQSAFRRLGFTKELVGQNFSQICSKLIQKSGLADESLLITTSGKINGESEIENQSAIVTVRTIPLLKNQSHIGALILIHDVTLLRKKDKALLGKDATIREVHHRVKNNLQTVSALLRIQARRANNKEVKKSLAEANRRISTIAIVHETLSYSKDEKVDFDEIVQKIILMLSELNMTLDKKQKTSILKFGEIGFLKSEIATPLAMALVEVLQNALEHGRPALQNAELHLESSNNELKITVNDFGPGLVNQEKNKESLGLDIVSTLIKEELHGEIQYLNNQPQGLTVKISISIDEFKNN